MEKGNAFEKGSVEYYSLRRRMTTDISLYPSLS